MADRDLTQCTYEELMQLFMQASTPKEKEAIKARVSSLFQELESARETIEEQGKKLTKQKEKLAEQDKKLAKQKEELAKQNKVIKDQKKQIKDLYEFYVLLKSIVTFINNQYEDLTGYQEQAIFPLEDLSNTQKALEFLRSYIADLSSLLPKAQVLNKLAGFTKKSERNASLQVIKAKLRKIQKKLDTAIDASSKGCKDADIKDLNASAQEEGCTAEVGEPEDDNAAIDPVATNTSANLQEVTRDDFAKRDDASEVDEKFIEELAAAIKKDREESKEILEQNQKNKSNLRRAQADLPQPFDINKIALAPYGDIECRCSKCGHSWTYKPSDRASAKRVAEMTQATAKGEGSALAVVQKVKCPCCQQESIEARLNRASGVCGHVTEASEEALQERMIEISPNLKDQIEAKLADNTDKRQQLKQVNARALMTFNNKTSFRIDLNEHSFLIPVLGLNNQVEDWPTVMPDDELLSYVSFMPMFDGVAPSIGFLTSIMHKWVFLGSPKSRLAKESASDATEGSGGTSKKSLMRYLSGMCRMFNGSFLGARRETFALSRGYISADETPLLVRKTLVPCKDAKGNPSFEMTCKKNYIWNFSSNQNGETKACYFATENGRSATIAEKHFDGACEDFGPLFKGVTTDKLSSYYSAIKKINEKRIKEGKEPLALQNCGTHARRAIHQYLETAKLLDVYHDITLGKEPNELFARDPDKFFDFPDALLNYTSERHPNGLSQTSKDILMIYWLLNLLYVIENNAVMQADGDFELYCKHLKHTRSTLSLGIIDQIFAYAFRLVKSHYEAFKVKSDANTGELIFQSNSKEKGGLTNALVYLLNKRMNMYTFIYHPELEFSQTTTERNLRLGVTNRKVFEFCDTEDGAHALAVALTLCCNCNLNGVSFKKFLFWSMANIKVRGLHLLREHTIEQHVPDMAYYEYDEQAKAYTKKTRCFSSKERSQLAAAFTDRIFAMPKADTPILKGTEVPFGQKQLRLFNNLEPCSFDCIETSDLTPANYKIWETYGKEDGMQRIKIKYARMAADMGIKDLEALDGVTSLNSAVSVSPRCNELLGENS